MTISTYAELQTAVKNWIERPDLADARVQEFIRLFEAYAQRQLTHRQMEKRADLTISARYTSLPSDYLQMKRVATASRSLEVETADTLQDMQDTAEFTAGEPTHYAILGDEIEVYPTPDTSYTATLYYIRTLPALSDSNTTNWLLTAAPDAYLYGALYHASSFLDFDERLQAFAAPMDAAISQLNAQSDKAKFHNQGVAARRRFYG